MTDRKYTSLDKVAITAEEFLVRTGISAKYIFLGRSEMKGLLRDISNLSGVSNHTQIGEINGMTVITVDRESFIGVGI